MGGMACRGTHVKRLEHFSWISAIKMLYLNFFLNFDQAMTGEERTGEYSMTPDLAIHHYKIFFNSHIKRTNSLIDETSY